MSASRTACFTFALPCKLFVPRRCDGTRALNTALIQPPDTPYDYSSQTDRQRDRERQTEGQTTVARERHSRRHRRQPPRTPSRRCWPTWHGTGAGRTPAVCCSPPPPMKPLRGPSPTPRLRNGRRPSSASSPSRNDAQST